MRSISEVGKINGWVNEKFGMDERGVMNKNKQKVNRREVVVLANKVGK